MEHLRTQNWVAVVLDFFIVVVGVFVGIQVDNWNQARISQGKELEYLSLLDRDLERGVSVLEQLSANIGQHVSAAQLISRSSGRTDIDVVDIEKAFSKLYMTYAYVPQQSTYIGLRNGAHLDILRDTELRSALVDFFEVRQNRFQAEYIRDYTLTQQRLHRHLANYVRFLPAERLDAFATPPDNLHWTKLIAPLSALDEDVEFLNDLAELGARGDEILGVIDVLMTELNAMRTTIDSQLNE